MEIICPHCGEQIQLEIKNTSVSTPDDTIMYFIADDQFNGSFGCWAGPHPDLEEMKNLVGHNHSSIIFKGNKKKTKKLYRWDAEFREWIKI